LTREPVVGEVQKNESRAVESGDEKTHVGDEVPGQVELGQRKPKPNPGPGDEPIGDEII